MQRRQRWRAALIWWSYLPAASPAVATAPLPERDRCALAIYFLNRYQVMSFETRGVLYSGRNLDFYFVRLGTYIFPFDMQHVNENQCSFVIKRICFFTFMRETVESKMV